jgi:hypothetical protein
MHADLCLIARRRVAILRGLMLPVHFFIEPAGITLERARTLDPDLEWQDMRRAKERWIVQAYARLRRRGHAVTLGNEVPARGFVIYHKEEHKLVLARTPRGGKPVLVTVRADFRSADSADFEIVQNGYFADGCRQFFIPLWPQPGLIARNPARGDRVERIAFKGNLDNVLSDLRSDEFKQRLASEGMVYELDAANTFDIREPMQQHWHDYSEVDVVLALRPSGSRDHTHKPATKLYNAWIAGTPAILNSDYAYRELRQGPLDYLEASNAEQAFAALCRLKREPELFRAMVENGRRRGAAFSPAALVQQWEHLLFELLPQRVRNPESWRYGTRARRLRGVARKAKLALLGTPRK